MNQTVFKNTIRKINAARMVLPGVFFAAIIFVMIKFPLLNSFFPVEFTSGESISSLYDKGIEYLDCTASTLYYSGYDFLKGSAVEGHYYYSLEDEKCSIYLIGKDFFKTKDVSPVLNNVSFKAQVKSGNDNTKQLLTLMARDMNWTYEGISQVTDTYIISEMNYGIVPSIILSVIIIIIFLYSVIHLLFLMYNIIFPDNSYTFSGMSHIHMNKRRTLIHRAYLELDNHVEFAQDDMYITQNFFICTDIVNAAIIPIESVVWAYKFSRLHRYFLWGKMTYTLRITMNNKKSHILLWKSKEDVDEVLALLQNKNPDMRIGYTEENRDSVSKYFNTKNQDK